jgi:hypothetical protein
MERIPGPWYWCVYCAKDLCEQHEQVDTHDPTHVFVKYKGEVDTRAFQYVSSRTISLRIQLTMGYSRSRFINADLNNYQPQIVPYMVYYT